MPHYQTDDPAFHRYVLQNAAVQHLAGGFEWAEGPVWFGDADCLLFSDIPSHRILRWSPETGISCYRAQSNYANGHTRDVQGRLVSCEHGARRVTRTELDGTITVLADSHDGRRLNSPNDVVVKSDGSVWFSDPHYGIVTDYEGFRAEQELPCVVYRWDPETGETAVVVADMNCPNGLAFSPDESLLYVADTGRRFSDDAQHIRVYPVEGKGLGAGAFFHKVDVGIADGLRLDEHGNVWTSAGDGVHCIAPDGRRLGKVLVPEKVSNVCFGGRARHKLYITATTGLYRVSLAVRGVQRP